MANTQKLSVGPLSVQKMQEDRREKSRGVKYYILQVFHPCYQIGQQR